MLYADMDTDVCHNYNRQNTLYNYRVVSTQNNHKVRSQSQFRVKHVCENMVF